LSIEHGYAGARILKKALPREPAPSDLARLARIVRVELLPLDGVDRGLVV